MKKQKIKIHYNKGKDNPMFGVCRFGKDAPFYGGHHTKEGKEKISKLHKGKAKTKEHKRKISESLTGRKLSEEHRRKTIEGHHFYSSVQKMCSVCGEMFRVIKCRSKTKKTCSRKCWKKLLIKTNSGKNNPNYKDGITPKIVLLRKSSNYRIWRDTVYVRDDWTCQQCRQVGQGLQAHHILSFTKYPNERFDVNNGITLCISCHQKLHRRLENSKRA